MTSAVDAIVGARMAARRRALGIRQVTLAETLGVTQPTISRMERGTIALTVSQLVRVAKALRTSPAMLLPMLLPDQ